MIAPTTKNQTCRQCSSTSHLAERDLAGITLTCWTCGTCTYLDRNGQPTTPEPIKGPMPPQPNPELMKVPSTDCQHQGTRRHPHRGGRQTCPQCASTRQSLVPPRQTHTWENAAVMEMYYAGAYPSQINRLLELPHLNTTRRWINTATQFALRETAADLSQGDHWSITQINFRESQNNYRIRIIMETHTQYILRISAALPEDDPEALLEIIKKALKRTRNPPEQIILDQETAAYQHVIRKALPTAPLETRTFREIAESTHLQEINGTLEKRRTNTSAKRPREKFQEFLDGLALDLNVFRTTGGPSDPTPAERAGLKPPFSTWDEVNDMITATNPRQKAKQKAGTSNAEPNGPGTAAESQDTVPEHQSQPADHPETSEPEVQDPRVHDPESADPEVQNPEVQNPEVQNPEAQDPEAQDPEAQDPEPQTTGDPLLTGLWEFIKNLREKLRETQAQIQEQELILQETQQDIHTTCQMIRLLERNEEKDRK